MSFTSKEKKYATFLTVITLFILSVVKYCVDDEQVLIKTTTNNNKKRHSLSINDTSHKESNDNSLSLLEKRANTSILDKICPYVNKQPLHHFWSEEFLPRLIDSNFDKDSDKNGSMSDWYLKVLQNSFSFRDWKGTIMHQPPQEAFLKILKLLNDRLTNKRETPVRIIVYGGSVALGGNSCASLKFGKAPIKETERIKVSLDHHCRWSDLLENYINDVFGKGSNIIHISNLARGATQSRNSVHMIDVQVLPQEYIERGWVGPDVVIWSHAVNDFLSGYRFEQDDDIVTDNEVGDDAEKKQLQDFHLAVQNMRCDDNDLPLVVYLNDYFGQSNAKATQSSLFSTWVGTFMTHVTWFDSMGISIDRLLWMHYLSNHHPCDKKVNDYNGLCMGEPLPLTDGIKGPHGGLLFHATIASAIVFNALSATKDTCYDLQYKVSDDTFSLTKNDALQSHILGFSSEVTKEDLIHNIENSLSTTYRQPTSCNIEQSKNGSVGTRSQIKCPYSWIIMNTSNNLLFGKDNKHVIQSPERLQEIMDKIIVYNNGWTSPNEEGEKLGWTATIPKAKFTAKIQVEGVFDHISSPLKKLRLSIMKSYDNGWINSSAEIHLIDSVSTTNGNKIYTISGHNTHSPTSYFMEYLLDLPKLSYLVDNERNITSATLIMQIYLVSGSKFKVSAMSLCF